MLYRYPLLLVWSNDCLLRPRSTALHSRTALADHAVAVQIHRDALTLGAHTGLRHTVVFGGIDYDKQRQELGAGCDVLIGTPGRLIDYFKQHVYDLRHGQVLVLQDLLGLTDTPPRFAEPVATLGPVIQRAAAEWTLRVRNGRIGGRRYSMSKGEAEKLRNRPQPKAETK